MSRQVHLCTAKLYEYRYGGRTWIFERRPIGPPYWPIRKDGEPFERLPPDGNEFWRALCTWNQEEDREQFRAD